MTKVEDRATADAELAALMEKVRTMATGPVGPFVRVVRQASDLAMALWRLDHPTPPRLYESYGAVHNALWRKGSARQHDCTECGGMAQEWAYNHGCPDERTGPDGHGSAVKFCPHLTHYQPMCKRCHRRMDSAARGGRNIKRKALTNG